jgi:hypothetical protein
MQSAHSIVDVGTLAQDARHGPLPLLLIVLTVVTGVVDAVSYFKLGHVFVANMTGNVLFLGFAACCSRLRYRRERSARSCSGPPPYQCDGRLPVVVIDCRVGRRCPL